MSKQLIESIIDGNYISAEHYFHDRLNTIMEQKLFEEKRRLAAINELVRPDPNRPGQFVGQNTKADWAKYRKQNPQLSFHGTPDNPKAKAPTEKREKTSTGSLTKHGLAARRKRGYIQAHPATKSLEFIRRVRKYKETGKLDEAEGRPGIFQQKYGSEFNVSNIPTGDNADPSAMRVSGAKKAKTDTVSRSKTGALRNVIGQQRAQASSDWADKKYEKHANVRTLKSIKNIVTGRNVGANFRNLKKYGSQSTFGKAAKGAAAGFTSALTSLEEEKG